MNTDTNESKDARKGLANAQRIVVKVGTSVVSTEKGYLDLDQIDRIAHQLNLALKNREVFLVSSGAIGAGMGILGLDTRPETLPELQAVAALGQSRLIQAYADAFSTRGFQAAQVLLTQSDFDDRARYLNARNTMTTLSSMGIVPVINENDTVVVDEIRFSDNDFLAALVTNLVRADLLVLLTDVDGLYDGDPSSADSSIVSVVKEVNEELIRSTSAKTTRLSRGGMASKLRAGAMAAAAGEAVVIASGRREDTLTAILEGEEIGTLILPTGEKMTSRKRWIGLTAKPRGSIAVDEGAEKAVRGGKSLLPSGITSIEGTFTEGDVVSITTVLGNEFGRGLTNYTAESVRAIKGLKTSEIAGVLGDKPFDEVVRRENIVILQS